MCSTARCGNCCQEVPWFLFLAKYELLHCFLLSLVSHIVLIIDLYGMVKALLKHFNFLIQFHGVCLDFLRDFPRLWVGQKSSHLFET